MNDDFAHIASRLFLEPIEVNILGTRTLAPLNVRKFAQILSAIEAGEFYNRHLYNRPAYRDYVEHLTVAARTAAKIGGGHFLEFGVASGLTIKAIAAVAPEVIGFDSFAGLPENWRDGVPVGAFASAPPEVPAGVTLKIGMIEETLPAFLAETGGEIRFIHIDTDLYGPARFILEACRTRMIDTVIVFDEFFNYPGWRDHEYKAWCEFQAKHAAEFSFDYLGCTESVAVSVRVTRR